jgi:tRNA(adenine34) deaminase
VDYKEIMQQALLLAKDAASAGDVPVGAVVVDDAGVVIGSGKNERVKNNDPLAHAEMVAIKSAARNLSNWRFDELTLVVTLEPCAMCAGAIVQGRFNRLVFGLHDKQSGAVGSNWDLIRNPIGKTQIEVIGGVLHEESQDLLSLFFQSKR